MNVNKNKQLYFLSLVVLAVLSAYPLINSVHMAAISITNGALEPEQYVKYVVPYAAICVSLLFFAAMQPVFLKLKRLAFPVGIGFAYGVFLALERFFETMQIRTSGMTLIDAATLTPNAAGSTTATVDIWQAALCIVSPEIREQSLTYALQESFFYVIGSTAYKVHYYLISLILIAMVCGLIYGVAKMLRSGDMSQKKPFFLRGVSTAALVALCVFANTTAFFRQAASIQTPLAAILTGAFFVLLGTVVGIYVGSYLFEKSKCPGIGIPVLLSLFVTVLMYIGEAVMMNGNLYRFGTGWFFRGLAGIVPAPVDILIVLLSGGITWLILGMARKYKHWPGKRTVITAIALCAAVASTGVVIAITIPKNTDDNIIGCYVFDKNLYTNPLSSSGAFGGLPYVYGFDENTFIIANTEGGDILSYTVEYYKTPVGTDEFSSKTDSLTDSLFSPADLTGFKERYLLAVMSDESGPKYGLYRMDGEVWLVELRSLGIWCIYRLVKTETTTLADLERVKEYYAGNPSSESSLGIYENSPKLYDNQMTLNDIYDLVRKGEALTLQDFDPFFYWLAGPDFTVRRYDVVGADIVFVTTREDRLESALLWSCRTVDLSQVIDLREGFEAVTEYMNPLGSFMDITIEDVHGGEDVRELIYEYDYDQCQYYLNRKRADNINIIFRNGERMSLKQALEERRITIEDTVAHGLYNVSMVPVNNPLGGEFVTLHHLYTFSLNGEAFYPSKSFMYVVWDSKFSVYYDIDELIQFLEWYGYDAKAKELRQFVDTVEITTIARGKYIRDTVLIEAGIESDVGWALSSHTPVSFNTKR